MNYLLLVCALFSFTLAENLKLLQDFSSGYNNFSANTYKKILESSPGNLIVCPLSVDYVIALINSGARGETSRQITRVLHIPEDIEKVHKTFSGISPYLHQNESYEVDTANKIYVQKNFNISAKYRNIVENVFKADIENVDFNKTSETADKINAWVENKTHDKIKNLVNPSILGDDVVSMIVNAIYFHGKWAKEFDVTRTEKSPFRIDKNTTVETDLMFAFEEFEVYESSELNATFLKLDYLGGDVSMNLVLPNDIEGLTVLEENILDVLTPPQYEMRSTFTMIPKFKIESEIQFTPILESLGITDLFTNHADLRGIGAEEEDLSVSSVIQKAFIEVDEKGTTAAAATFGLIDVRLGSGPATFIADHPFLFYLRLNKPGINFFIGRYTSP